MFILKSEIDSLFLHAWIQYHKITIDQLELKPVKKTNQVQKYEITSEVVLGQLDYDYKLFTQSKQSVEDFLNIDIITFKCNSQNNYFTSKTKCLDRQIILLFQKRNSSLYILDGIALSELNSTHPIEISLESILSIYQITESVNILPLDELNIYDFEDKYEVCIDIYKRNGNMSQKYWDIPGNRDPPWTPKHRIKMAVDNLNIPYLPKYFWLPCDSLITKELFCTKLRGICAYSTTSLQNLKKHEMVCSDETTIESKQVIKGFLIKFYLNYRFPTVLMMIDSTS